MRTRRGRLARVAIVVVILLLLVVIAGSYLLQPQRASALLLDRVGKSLGLKITASGQSSYRLRGTPQLVLRDVVAQRPGDAVALLRAERVFVSVPWSTIRARGSDLTVQRIELDTPILDVPALQRWQATRPTSEETRIPTLIDGLRIVRGRIDNNEWRIDDIAVDLPSLAPDKPLSAHLQGRYLDPPTTLPFDFDVALTKPANDAGVALIGKATLEGEDWKLPAHIHLSGPLHLGDGDVSMVPAKVGISTRYLSAGSNLPFTLGAAGPLHFNEGVWALDPAALILHGGGMIPDATANGALALGRRLVLRLHGEIAAWPDAWPALPPPLSASTSPMDFSLNYVGRVDFSEAASLAVHRDDTTFDAQFKLPAVMDWINADVAGSPLPPLQGRMQTPQLDISGATLEGVEIEFSDDTTAPAATGP